MAYQKLLSQIMGHSSVRLNSKHSQSFGTFSMWLQALTFLKLTVPLNVLFELQNIFSTKMMCFWHCSYTEHLPSLNWKLAQQNWPTEESSDNPPCPPPPKSLVPKLVDKPSLDTRHNAYRHLQQIYYNHHGARHLPNMSPGDPVLVKLDGHKGWKQSGEIIKPVAKRYPIYWKPRKALFSDAIGETFAHYMWMTTIHRCHFQGL